MLHIHTHLNLNDCQFVRDSRTRSTSARLSARPAIHHPTEMRKRRMSECMFACTHPTIYADYYDSIHQRLCAPARLMPVTKSCVFSSTLHTFLVYFHIARADATDRHRLLRLHVALDYACRCDFADLDIARPSNPRTLLCLLHDTIPIQQYTYTHTRFEWAHFRPRTPPRNRLPVVPAVLHPIILITSM